MKIAILADIHGNSVALKNCLIDARQHGVDRLIILGDLIGYYYDVSKVLGLLSDWPYDVIRGNHERFLKAARDCPKAASLYRSKYGSAIDLALATLSPSQVDWLTSLPDRATLNYGGLALEICHGSPRDPDEYVYPDSPAEILEACRIPGRDMVLMGHTHYPMLIAGGGSLLVNPGSVGQARDRGGYASWCHIDTRTNALIFEKTPYETADIVEEVRKRDPDLPYLAQILRRGQQ